MEYCAGNFTSDGLLYVAVWISAFLQSDGPAETFAERRPTKFVGR
ncbi:hypothetical protein [Myxococcus sp. CA051A]|nr:hypothetical protein [Myxococcus sp. CA051A]